MRLVVQGRSLTAVNLKRLSDLCGNSDFIQIAPYAYYLSVNQIFAEAHSYCAKQRLDCAFVPDNQTLKNFGLVVMDMDSTFISIECIDEIADMCNLKPQVAAITESAMRGEIEFAESLRRRVKLLAGLHESALQRVVDERLKLSPGAQQLINVCKDYGIKTMLISGGFNFFADRLKAMTGLDYTKANALEISSGKLTGQVLGNIINAQGKADALIQLREKLGLKDAQVIAIGDGANDLKMMATAGVSIAYHAKPVVQQQATYTLNYVGLEGVVSLFTTV